VPAAAGVDESPLTSATTGVCVFCGSSLVGSFLNGYHGPIATSLPNT